MSKYIVAAYESFYWEITSTANSAIVEDKLPRDTGLVDKNGKKIYSVPDTVPFGFVSGGKDVAKVS